MAGTLITNIYKNVLKEKICSTLYVSVRNGHHVRGRQPGVAKSLEQKLEELRFKDPELHYRVNIGLPSIQKSRPEQLQDRLKVLKQKRNDGELEKLARNNQLLIDLNKAKQVYLTQNGPDQIKIIADHYSVFEHLFGDAYFIPRVPLKIFFQTEDLNIPVYYGNVVKPKEATVNPNVSYHTDDNTLWTLVLTNPDGHLTKNDAEYVHWFVGNIPGNKLENGETIISYIRPFPPKGTGYHRHIFILYKQDRKLNFSKLRRDGPCLTLADRTFKTLDFYREFQDNLTPAGLAFFQADWDDSVQEFYHKTLGMKEPIFEYDFPPQYMRKEEWFPKRRPFNLYLDRYRDPKQINKEFLERKLKKVHPFRPPHQPLPYPNAQYFNEYVPSWLKWEIRKSRLNWGRINEIEKEQ